MYEAVDKRENPKEPKRTIYESPVKGDAPDFTADQGKGDYSEAGDDSRPKDPLVSDGFEPRDNKEERDD